MKYTRLVRYYLLFFCAGSFPAQRIGAQVESYKIDSLKTALSIVKADTTKLNLLFTIGESLWFNRQIPEAINYLKETISFGEEKKDYRHQCNAQLLLGHAWLRMEKYDSALTAITSSLSCSQKNTQPEHIPKAYQAFSILYKLLGDPAKAIDYGLKAADGYEESNIENINVQSIFAWDDVGQLFEQQRQPDKALEYYEKALQKAKGTKKDFLIKAPMLGIANVYLAQGRLTDAKKLYEEVIVMDRKVGGAEPTMDGLNGLGTIAIKEKNYPVAISFFKAALDTATRRNFIIAIDGYTSNLGYAYLLNNQYDSASRLLDIALKASLKNGDVVVQKEVYSHLAEMEIKRGNLNKAVIYQQQLKSLSDSLYNVDRVRAVNNLEILYETEKKEKNMAALQVVNAKKEVALIKRNRLLLAGGIALGALLLTLSLYYRYAKQKQRLAESERTLQQEQIKFLKEQQQVVSLQSMVNGQEAERTRIAKDLHDGLGGLFSTIKMQLSTLKHEEKNLEQNELFKKSYELVDNASVEVRRIAHNMMPEVLMKLGLADGVKDMCNNISSGKLLKVNFQAYGMEKRLNASTEIMLYRIIQELLNNIIKHSQATEAIVQFNREGNRLHVTVEDNGRGFNTMEADGKIHAGLETVQSRVNYLNGDLSIESKQGLGTTVMMDFLINEE